MIALEPFDLEYFSFSCFLPSGLLKLHYEKKATGEIIIKSDLPPGITGYLKWEEKLTPLLSGFNEYEK